MNSLADDLLKLTAVLAVLVGVIALLVRWNQERP